MLKIAVIGVMAVFGDTAAKRKGRVWDACHYGSLSSPAVAVFGKDAGSG